MLNFGFIGIGQGGCNIVNAFAKDFPCLAINTAETDLAELDDIPPHLRVLTKVTEGGAGKNIRLGELAIIRYRDQIREKIQLTMDRSDLIWVVAGLGGGTGSLGIVQLITLLAAMGKKHGAIITLPTADEGTVEKVNALIAAKQLYDLQNMSKNFRSMIIIDNDKLKQQIFSSGNLSYEKFYDEANSVIYKDFINLYNYSKMSSITAFDTEDYKGMFYEKGCLIFSEANIEFSENETALASAVTEMWRSTVFECGDVARATAVALIIERPKSFDKDGQQINRLFEEIKKRVSSGRFCRGVYHKEGLKDLLGAKPIKVFTLLAGLPFPEQKFSELKAQVDQEMQDIKAKRQLQELAVDLEPLLNFVNETNNDYVEEELDFSIFGVKEPVLNWSFPR